MWNPPETGRSVNCFKYWEMNSNKIDPLGPSGLSVISIKNSAQTLVYRDEDGILLGLLNYYPRGFSFTKKSGEVEVMVHPDHRRKGVGMVLIKEAMRLWDIQAKNQRYNEAGAGLTGAWLKEYRENR